MGPYVSKIKTMSNKNFWIAVNPDGNFVGFDSKPTKTKIYEIVESKTEYEFTPYGDTPKYIRGEKYKECWASTNYNGEYVLGIHINPSNLSTNLQDLSWDDSPIIL